MLAELSGKAVTDNVRTVVKLIGERAGADTHRFPKMEFKSVVVANHAAEVKPGSTSSSRIKRRGDEAGHASEVVISSEEVGTTTGIGKSAAYRAITAALDAGLSGQ